jgi:hypothetical protein
MSSKQTVSITQTHKQHKQTTSMLKRKEGERLKNNTIDKFEREIQLFIGI